MMKCESRLARLLTTIAQIDDICARVSAEAKRIVNRLWPGRMGIVVSSERGGESFRSPAHAVIDALSAGIDFPLWIVEPQRVDGAEETATAVADQSDEGIAVIVDAGPIAARTVTWVAAVPGGWRIEQPGSVTEAEIAAAAARWIVFVCTGNTCRSPMAESLFKTRLAERLGCRIEDLPVHGYRVLSAGVAAYPGDAPSPEAVDVLREFGAELAEHRSQPLSMEMALHADCLIGMTRSHLLAVLARFPAVGGSLRLLCGNEGDLDDPIGCGIDVYATCARTILRHVDRLIMELECK